MTSHTAPKKPQIVDSTGVFCFRSFGDIPWLRTVLGPYFGAIKGTWLAPSHWNTPRQLLPQTHDHQQHQTACEGLRADRRWWIADRNPAVWRQVLALQAPPPWQAREGHDRRQPAFTIEQTRDRHQELCALVACGQSPAKAKQAAASAQKQVEARRLSFRSFLQLWVGVTLFHRSGGYVLHLLDLQSRDPTLRVVAQQVPCQPRAAAAEFNDGSVLQGHQLSEHFKLVVANWKLIGIPCCRVHGVPFQGA